MLPTLLANLPIPQTAEHSLYATQPVYLPIPQTAEHSLYATQPVYLPIPQTAEHSLHSSHSICLLAHSTDHRALTPCHPTCLLTHSTDRRTLSPRCPLRQLAVYRTRDITRLALVRHDADRITEVIGYGHVVFPHTQNMAMLDTCTSLTTCVW